MTISLENKKKRIILASRILIILTVVSIFLLPAANASPDNKKLKSMVEDITTGPLESALAIVNGPLYTEVTSETFVNTNFANVYTILQILGVCTALIIAFFRLFKNLEEGKDPAENTIKMLIEVALVSLVIINASAILELVNKMGSLLINSFSPTTISTSNPGAGLSTEEFIAAIDGNGKTKGGFTWELDLRLQLIFPWIGAKIAQLLTRFIVIQIIIEIGLRKIFIPLAIADIYGEGLRSPGFRYIKRLFAVYIKLAIALTVMVLSSTLAGILIGGMPNNLDKLFMIVLIYFTCASLMMKGSELANDITG